MSRFLRVALAACTVLTLSYAASAVAGEYRNPVLTGFNPDPSICRDGDDYYLATSTFEYFPGVPIYHSKDLVNWRLVGHALDRPSQLPLAGQKSSQGIFAPTLRCGNGRFYMITTNVTGGGNFIVQATSPGGPWSEPVWIKDAQGIDPSLFFDEDGKVYLTYQDGGERGGIAQAEIDVATGKLKTQPRRIWNGTGGVWPEGPHLYKINGWYYLLHAEGGTSYGHVVILARSRSPWGPFEGAPDNPILTHRDRPELLLQALGHADLVQTPAGKWFMVLLGVRHLKHKHHLGRETLLAPVEWTADGWLKVNGGAPLAEKMQADGLPAPHPWPAAPARDEFGARTLGGDWIFLRAPARDLWSLAERPGFLRLKGTKLSLSDIGTPAFVGRRQAHLNVRASTFLDFAPRAAGQEAGLALRMNEDNHYQLLVAGSGKGRVIRLLTRVKGVNTVLREAPLGAGKVELIVRATAERYVFGYRLDGGKGGREVADFGSAPTAPLSSEDAGGFTGVGLGMVAHNPAAAPMPPADFDWFDYRPGAED
ncbi:glycoside hydrolase family 43 protein [Massilia sp. IC2-477]|uniref:glycoside hydrolase family 43 protein n=1 Tax=Massilia sp. IC2-477 TaxID=2887198 RepID=UPI001D10942A|nr:glycoside hydrolase family 43 protein [Massilia sp. IC2-477]MCC2957384.1 glycoside hydrolase family 43 protein [Massilia sp. IC2-477]